MTKKKEKPVLCKNYEARTRSGLRSLRLDTEDVYVLVRRDRGRVLCPAICITGLPNVTCSRRGLRGGVIRDTRWRLDGTIFRR
ncbi:hypothetical protein EVAR_6838_1 [Eumeta japonica]|uniref:Uncharacterized protein n=1 Tax=Eumeta variegata TaxID=151549 RepID=A0A4C1U7P9_EUMVA|nr:hypothetical protein EVAR_6838_1 [Eumeta japonica]